jgi:uncharacterized membrane protein
VKYFIVLWLFFIIFSLFVSYFYRYYIVDKNILNFHNEQFEEWTDEIILMKYGDYLNKKQ